MPQEMDLLTRASVPAIDSPGLRAALAVLAPIALTDMRVIAGSFKGRRLVTPRWAGLRPTSDKLRETLFNVVAARLPGARVLDGFAGTGALGIEALSRGAAHVTFVECDRRAAALIAENLGRCGVEEGYAIICAPFREAVGGRLAPRDFDLIFLDPPYDKERLDGILKAAGDRLADAGLLVLEHARRRRAPEAAGHVQWRRTLASGDSALGFYESAAQERTRREPR